MSCGCCHSSSFNSCVVSSSPLDVASNGRQGRCIWPSSASWEFTAWDGLTFNFVQHHPTMGVLVPGSKQNLVKFWNPRTRTALTMLCVFHTPSGSAVQTQCPLHIGHRHKNTMQALARALHGNVLATASQDKMVQVFDICFMKERVVVHGHEKEVCCTSRLPLSGSRPDTSLTPCHQTALAWHPMHPILDSGSSESMILR